jgi:alkanesulfonate monooxygenase SsuD/methylene tetrahydromethanopterin reductase-like flavin-dependent oxidoreductase (luciferase family)
MHALWAEPHVTFKGKRHTIEDAGINPRPASGRVPVWFGGHHERTLQRIAKWGDGWMPNAYQPDQSALDVFGQLRTLTEPAGREPAEVGIEGWVSRVLERKRIARGRPRKGSRWAHGGGY